MKKKSIKLYKLLWQAVFFVMLSLNSTIVRADASDCPTITDWVYSYDNIVQVENVVQDEPMTMGSPVFVTIRETACKPAKDIKISFEAGSGTTSVGSFSGEVSITTKGGLPAGYSLEASGTLKYMNSTTRTLTWEAHVEENATSVECGARVGQIGPGEIDRTITEEWERQCTYYRDPIGYVMKHSEHYDSGGTATLTYVASDVYIYIYDDALTSEEMDACCDKCSDE